MANELKESQKTHFRDDVLRVVDDLVKQYIPDILKALNDLYEDSGTERKASLDVPINLKLMLDSKKGYGYSGKIEVKKVEKTIGKVNPFFYKPDIPDFFEDDDEDENDNEQEECDTSALDSKEPVEGSKPGDNGAKFVMANRTVDIVDYEDVSAELTPEVLKDTVIAKSMNGDKMVAFTEADLLAKSFKVPGGNFRIIRGKSKDGKMTNYFIQLLPAAESQEPETAPANAPEEKKGKGRSKKKDEAAQAPAPEKQQEAPEEKKPEEKKPDTQAQAQNISLFLAKHNLSVAEVETLLRREKRLGISTSLQTTATAVEYVMNNIEDIKEALKKTA